MIIVVLITILVVCFSTRKKMGVTKLGKKMEDKISYKNSNTLSFYF